MVYHGSQHGSQLDKLHTLDGLLFIMVYHGSQQLSLHTLDGKIYWPPKKNITT